MPPDSWKAEQAARIQAARDATALSLAAVQAELEDLGIIPLRAEPEPEAEAEP